MGGYTHFSKLATKDGIFAVGEKGKEVALVGLFEPGNQFFVDSGTGSDSKDGKSWATALATLDAAIGKCTANNGDIIWIAPGHSESWTTTGAKVVADIAGVRIIGMGEGADRPTFSFGHTGTTWTISAANVTMANLLFVSAVDSITTFGTISGNDCTLLDVETRDTTDIEVISAFTVTGDRLTVKNHFHNGYTGGNANARVFSLNGVDNALFENCRFMTKVTTAVINFVSNACTNVIVKNCDFLVTSTTNFSKTVVDTIGGSTWEVRDCFDLGAGSFFSGGSGAALAGDDMSAVTALIGTITNTGGTATIGAVLGDAANTDIVTRIANAQTDIGNPSARTNFQSIEAMIGVPDGVNSSIDDMIRTGYDSTAITANANGSIMERQSWLEEKLGTLANTGGTADLASIIGDVNNVSMATNLAKIGTIVNTGGTATLGGVLGDAANTDIVTRIANAQTDIGNPSARTNFQSIEAMIGIPDAANSNLDDYIRTGADTTAITANANGSILERQSWLEEKLGTLANTGGIADIASIYGDVNNVSFATSLANTLAALYGANGIASFPAAAAPGNAVSLAEVIRAIYDRQLGDGTNASTNSRLGKKVTRAGADIFDGTQKALFTIAGGRVLVTSIAIEVTTAAIDAGASNAKIMTNPTVGTDKDMCAVLDINADELGTIYSITGEPATALTGGSGGGANGMISPWIVAEGTIDLNTVADVGTGGALGACELWYIPLDDGATVTST